MDELDIFENDSEQIKYLKRKIINLESQLSVQQYRNESVRGGNLLATEDIDYYQGEQLDFVLSILEQVKPRCPEGSRPRDIIESILSVNKPVGRGEEILNEVNKIFKKGNPSMESDILKLKSMGFSYTPSRKHPKLRFRDKYLVVLPSSPSDSKRGALNGLAEINKCIAVSQKV